VGWGPRGLGPCGGTPCDSPPCESGPWASWPWVSEREDMRPSSARARLLRWCAPRASPIWKLACGMSPRPPSTAVSPPLAPVASTRSEVPPRLPNDAVTPLVRLARLLDPERWGRPAPSPPRVVWPSALCSPTGAAAAALEAEGGRRLRLPKSKLLLGAVMSARSSECGSPRAPLKAAVSSSPAQPRAQPRARQRVSRHAEPRDGG